MSTQSHSGSAMEDPTVGCPVFTSEGTELGKVKSVHGGYFELDVRMAPDYWLSRSYVGSMSGDRLELNISAADAEKHRLTRPGLEGTDA